MKTLIAKYILDFGFIAAENLNFESIFFEVFPTKKKFIFIITKMHTKNFVSDFRFSKTF